MVTKQDNKEELTPKNLMKTLFKFYQEYLSPLEPVPSFRHVLMWALQTGEYSINWNFITGRKISWAAAEATWRLMLDPTAAKDWDVVQAAMVNVGLKPEEEHKPLNEFMNDGYNSDQFDELRVRIADEREQANDDRLENMQNDDEERARNHPQTQPGVRGRDSQAEIVDHDNDIMTELTDYLDGLEAEHSGEGSDDGSVQAGTGEVADTPLSDDETRLRPMPPWAQRTAKRLSKRPRSPSVDSDVSRTESEIERDMERGRLQRARYIDDEAVEDDDDEV